MLELRNVHAAYGRVKTLYGISLEAKPGEIQTDPSLRLASTVETRHEAALSAPWDSPEHFW